MAEQPTMPDRDQRLETALSRVLACGTLLAALVIVAGAGLTIAASRAGVPVSFKDFTPGPADLTIPVRVLRDASHLQPAAVLQLGVILLVLTPVARVAATLALFALRRDLLYTVIAGIVLATLVLGLAGAIR